MSILRSAPNGVFTPFVSPLDDGFNLVIESNTALSYSITAESGTYGLTGQAATLTQALQVGAGQGSYALTGQAIGASVSRAIVAGQGTYSLSGQSASILLAGTYTVGGGQGTYTLSGQNANLFDSSGLIAMTAESLVYILSGSDVVLTYSGVGAYFWTDFVDRINTWEDRADAGNPAWAQRTLASTGWTEL